MRVLSQMVREKGTGRSFTGEAGLKPYLATLQELANRLRRDISSLSAAANRLEQHISEDAELKRTAHQPRSAFEIS